MTSKANDRQEGGDHYKKVDYQHWDWSVDHNIGCLEYAISKYICRWRDKNGISDVEKALHYSEKLYEVVMDGKYRRHDRSDPSCIGPDRFRTTQQIAELHDLSTEELAVCFLCVDWKSEHDIKLMMRLIHRIINNHRPKKKARSKSMKKPEPRGFDEELDLVPERVPAPLTVDKDCPSCKGKGQYSIGTDSFLLCSCLRW
jgi:hypothetical protein